jgi:hypothetical protein
MWVKEFDVRKDVARKFVLQRPVGFAVFSGVAVVATSFGAGLLLLRAHGGSWPWWFHGIVIASITGFLAALITYSVCNSWLRERNRAKNQEQIIAEVNHHINNALTIIRGRNGDFADGQGGGRAGYVQASQVPDAVNPF